MMIRLLAIALVATAIRTQVVSGSQAPVTCTCSSPGPSYNLLPPNYRGKYQTIVANGPPGANAQPLPCSCGAYPSPAPAPGSVVIQGPAIPPASGYQSGSAVVFPSGPPSISGPPALPGPPASPGYPSGSAVVFPPGPPSLPGPPTLPGPPAPGYPTGSAVVFPPGSPAPPCSSALPGPPGYPSGPAVVFPPGHPSLPAALSGPPAPGYPSGSVVVFSQGPLPQAAPTYLQPQHYPGYPVAPAVPELPPNRSVDIPVFEKPSSHIMTIPKKDQPSFAVGSPVSVNSIYSAPSPPAPTVQLTPPPPPAPVPQQPLYFTQPASLVSSCPATVVYPATQPLSPQNNAVFAPPKGLVAPPSTSPTSGGGYSQPVPIPTVQTPPGHIPSASAAKPSSPKGAPGPSFLLGAKKDVLPGSSLEAENNDCAIPVPPPLVKLN